MESTRNIGVKMVGRLEKLKVLLKMARTNRRFNQDVSLKEFIRRTFLMYPFFSKEKIVKHNDKYVFSTFMPPFPSKAFDNMLIATKTTIDFLKGTAPMPVPISVYFSLTNKCICNCYFCSNALNTGQELETRDTIEVIKQLQDFGVSIIGFTGGEPLLRKDLAQIIASVDERSATLLFTTGIGFTKDVARSLKDAGLFSIVVSLDHYRKEEHNRIKGHSKAFDSALAAIDYSNKVGLYVTTNTIPSIDMIRNGDIWEFLHFAESIGVDEVRILDPIPTGAMLGKPIFTEEDIALLKKLHVESNRRKDIPRVSVLSYFEGREITGCGAGGIRHMYVDASGNLHPCDMVPLSFGNILEDGLINCMERMAKAFPLPHEECFMRRYSKEVADFMKSNDTKDIEKIIFFCSSLKDERLSKFFERMM